MLSLYQLLVGRLKALVLADVGHDIQADFLTQDAARQAELLRLANKYEEEGFADIAQQLRGSVEVHQPDEPLSSSVSIAENLSQSAPNGCLTRLSTSDLALDSKTIPVSDPQPPESLTEPDPETGAKRTSTLQSKKPNSPKQEENPNQRSGKSEGPGDKPKKSARKK